MHRITASAALICAISLLALHSSVAVAAQYTITDLGTLGGTSSQGFGINDSGQVTGYADLAGDAQYHAFLYDGTMHDLGTLGGANAVGRGINASGQITGYADLTSGPTHAFLYDGTMHDLGTLGGGDSYGLGINDSGQVTGGSYMSFYDPVSGNLAERTFLYDGTMHDLGTLGNDSVGFGINASGQITGYTAGQPFLYDGTMHDLGSGNIGYGINASGQVTGGGGGQHTFLYDGTMHDLGTLGGFPGEGLGINASGQITGYSYTIGWEGQHAFLYSGGSMVDLNTLVGPASPWTLTAGQAINDLGQITGYGKIGGETHAFVLSPEGVAGLGSNQTADSGGGVGTVAGVEATFGNVTAVGTLTSTYLEANSLDQLQQFTGTNLAFDAGGILQAWDLSFSGTFSGSATITLHYDPTTLNGTPESELIVWHFVDHNHWEKVAGEVIDTNAHTVTFTTDSFSPFALGVPEPSSLTLAGLGAFGLIACAWRRRRR